MSGRGQAMVEFAMTVGVFLMVLLGAVEASLYTFERSAAVTAVAAGARVAAGGTGGARGVDRPDLAGALDTVRHIVLPSLPGTRVTTAPPGGGCPGLEAVAKGDVLVCAWAAGGTVTVVLRGWPRSLAPDVLGLGLGLDVDAEVHTVTFGR